MEIITVQAELAAAPKRGARFSKSVECEHIKVRSGTQCCRPAGRKFKIGDAEPVALCGLHNPKALEHHRTLMRDRYTNKTSHELPIISVVPPIDTCVA